MSKLNIFMYTTIAVGIMLGIVTVMWYFRGAVIEDLEKEAVALRLEVALGTANNQALNNAIKDQNEKFEAIKVDYESRILTYKNRAPKIKTIIKTVYLKDVNQSKGECENVKSIFDNIRSAGV